MGNTDTNYCHHLALIHHCFKVIASPSGITTFEQDPYIIVHKHSANILICSHDVPHTSLKRQQSSQKIGAVYKFHDVCSGRAVDSKCSNAISLLRVSLCLETQVSQRAGTASVQQALLT